VIQEETAIAIYDLTKFYRGNSIAAVNKVSLDIRKGSIFGLLGPNGAGKTTMIRMLCGLLPCTSGEVIIGGFSLKRQINEIKKIIGVVPQEIALYPSLNARENLSVFGGICGMKGEILKSRMNYMLNLFGLERSQYMQVGQYSGGMKRRLNLVAGLLHNPRILFLDEPTVGIDVQSKNVIIENLMDINLAGTTIVYTSHYLEEAENLCSHLAIIDEGQIIAQGSLEEIRQKNKTASRLEDIFLELTGKNLRD
jgi:ABC-2 type transport system ATP-binding protein